MKLTSEYIETSRDVMLDTISFGRLDFLRNKTRLDKTPPDFSTSASCTLCFA
jgi:hypothetical protein